MMRNLMKILLIGLISTLLVSCYTSTKYESTGEYIDSAAITTKVKAILLDDLGTSGFAIQVKTYKDEVQLSGFVDSPWVKKRAAQLSMNVGGVRKVRNNLIVKS